MKKNLTSSINGVAAMMIALSLAACSQTKQLKEMHDSTGQMNETTKDMNNNMGKLKDSTAGLCVGSTQALPLQARQGALIQMDNQATTPAGKLAQAAIFMQAFDFQVYSLCSTDQDMLDRMLDDAAQEFYQDMARYDNGSSLPNPLIQSAKVGSKAANDISFNVMGAAMHLQNRIQLDNHQKNPSMKLYSLLSITEQALRDGAKVDRGLIPLKQLKQYEVDILTNKAIAIKTFQARQNMIAAAIVGYGKSVSGNELSNLLSLGGDRYLGKLTGHVFTWNYDISQYNVAQLSTYSDQLSMALETRNFLREMGVEPVIEGNLKALITGMTATLPATTPAAKGDVNTTALTNARQQYQNALKKLQSDY